MNKLRRRIYSVVDTPDEHDRLGHGFGVFIMALIILNIFAMVLQSVEEIGHEFHHFFMLLEVVSVLVFTVEYVLRVWACVENPKYVHPLYGRVAFMISFMALVDLLAIAPFYLEHYIFAAGTLDLRFVRVLRLFRLFRLFKLGRYTDAFSSFRNVLVGRREELLISLFTVLLLLVFTSSIMHVVEQGVYRDSDGVDPFDSIPKSMWYCLVTLTTVGYGDVYPHSALGKFFAGFIALLGIGMIAIPAGILGGGFTEEIARRKREREERATKKLNLTQDTAQDAEAGDEAKPVEAKSAEAKPAEYAAGGGLGMALLVAKKFQRIAVADTAATPAIKGTTVSVTTVLSMTADGMTREQVASALKISVDDVAEALRFAADYVK